MLTKAKKDYDDAQKELKQQEEVLASAVDLVKSNPPEIFEDSEPIFEEVAQNAEEPIDATPS